MERDQPKISKSLGRFPKHIPQMRRKFITGLTYIIHTVSGNIMDMQTITTIEAKKMITTHITTGHIINMLTPTTLEGGRLRATHVSTVHIVNK